MTQPIGNARTMTRPAGPSDDSLILTPLGPGGRPFARWRTPVALIALLILGGVAALMLSARAPGAIGEVGERVSERVRAEVPESTQARESARVRLERAGLDERDTLAHIGLWAGATLLVGLATWSWRSLAGAVVLVVAASTALELAQETLSPTRITEWSDVLANLMGIAVGVAAVVALNSVSGLPARVRRSRERS
jgi:hypothetical protein